MKKIILSFLSFLFFISAYSQTVVFSDDFESGTSNWNIVGYWGTTTEKAVSGSYSFTDSPYSTYYNGYFGEQTATMATGVDLTVGLDAYVTFSAQVDLETGFDYMYLEASTDGGVTWLEVAEFNGEGFFTWTDYSFSLGAFVCSSDVRLRFRFAPDYAYEVDGMYIDDFTITSYPDDVSAPLVLHTPLPLFEGSLLEHTITADVIDCAGIESTELYYNVDGGPYSSVTGINTGGDTYEYTIPAQTPGSFVDYYIDATDASPSHNTVSSERWSIIAGEHVFYDDGATGTGVSIFVIGELSGTEYASVKVTLDDPTQLVGMIITNYTQIDLYEVDSIEIHVWADDGTGNPGDDMIEPFKVWPEATLENPYGSTRVDLRDYAAELSGLTGDIFIGYGMPGGQLPAVYSLSSYSTRSKYYSFGFWYDEYYDFEFRAVTTGDIMPPAADFSYVGDPSVTFTDLSANTPTGWSWTFGDGGTSTEQNPVHAYTENGLYDVCLTATNIGGSSTACKSVAVNNAILAPVADFTYTLVGNSGTFTDASSNEPTSWSWDFDDGATSTLQNATHTFASGGIYNVCLTASNTAGFNTKCQQVDIPVAIDEIDESTLSLYPNPAHDQVVITSEFNMSDATVQLFNAAGQLIPVTVTVNSGNSIQLNVNDIPAGNYVIKISNDNFHAEKTISFE